MHTSQHKILFSISCFFFFNDPAPTEIYTRPYTLSPHDALPISPTAGPWSYPPAADTPRAPARWRSEEHTSELQSHGLTSYAVFCLKKKNGNGLGGAGVVGGVVVVGGVRCTCD